MAVPDGDIVLADGSQLRYGCDLTALPAELAARFVALEHDADAQRFVEHALARPHGWLASASFALLRRVLTDYDAYGLLGMYPMHLCSTQQFARLLSPAGTRPGRSLLDVGAGTGAITLLAAAAGFERVATTESSAVLRARLRQRGLRVLGYDLEREPVPEAERADAVLALNVLDRTSHPRTMLGHLRDALLPGGVLLLSLPLPLRPHVQRAGGTADPEELLPDPRDSWEAGAASLVDELLTPARLEVLSLSRAPYLSAGERTHALHALDAALFTCRPTGRPTGDGPAKLPCRGNGPP